MQEISAQQTKNRPKQEKTVYRPQGIKSRLPVNRSVLIAVANALIKGFLAGFMVSVGGTVYLSTDSRYLGAAMFCIGLFVIFSYGFDLYTGKIGYCVVQNKTQNLLLIPVWFGNLCGALFVGSILRFTRIYEKIYSRADDLCASKLADNAFSILLLSFFCGLLMFIAADGFKNAVNTAQKYLSVLLPVMVFILCGFEHCVANMYYFTVAQCWGFKTVWYLIIMTVGNSLGGVLIPLCHKAIRAIRGLGQSE